MSPPPDEQAAERRVVPVDDRTFTACMEQLQEGYVASVSAAAGCTAEFVRRDVHGFDVLLTRPSEGIVQEVSVYAQLKNTTMVKPDPAASHFSYRFHKRENVLKLVGPRKDPKAILIVMVTTPDQVSWTHSQHEFLTVRHCCYWAHLEGTVVPQVESPTVRVPTTNVFDGPALREILDKLDQGKSLRDD